jgi:hypothetical protein
MLMRGRVAGKQPGPLPPSRDGVILYRGTKSNPVRLMGARTSLAVAAAAGLVLVSPAPAQLIAYDPFNHAAPFQLNGTASSGGGATWPSANTWQPFGGNGGSTQPGNLTYGPLLTNGNHADFPRIDVINASIRSMAANQGGPGRDLWMSVVMSPSANDQGMAIYNGTTTEEVFVGTPSGLTNFALRVDGGFTGGAQQTAQVGPTVAANGLPHFVALHLSFTTAGNSTITMYVDPDFSSLGTGAAPTGGSTVSFSNGNPFPFESIALGNAGPVGTNIGFDEFRMGTTWASVSPVPEPSSLILAGCGLFGLAARRWRRSSGRRR